MNRSRLIDKLDKVTDKAAALAIKQGVPVKMSKKSTLIGNLFANQNSDGFYDVIVPVKGKVYENISVFDVAVIIAQRYNSGEMAVIKKVLALEERYSKHHTDMIHYLSCLKGAKKNRDIERMAILEDKFQVAEILAKSARDSISIFKRVK